MLKEIHELVYFNPNINITETLNSVSIFFGSYNRYIKIVVNKDDNTCVCVNTLNGIYTLKIISVIDIKKELEICLPKVIL